jgi:hypothetical protein
MPGLTVQHDVEQGRYQRVTHAVEAEDLQHDPDQARQQQEKAVRTRLRSTALPATLGATVGRTAVRLITTPSGTDRASNRIR